jgi:hypothetical protein
MLLTTLDGVDEGQLSHLGRLSGFPMPGSDRGPAGVMIHTPHRLWPFRHKISGYFLSGAAIGCRYTFDRQPLSNRAGGTASPLSYLAYRQLSVKLHLQIDFLSVMTPLLCIHRMRCVLHQDHPRVNRYSVQAYII